MFPHVAPNGVRRDSTQGVKAITSHKRLQAQGIKTKRCTEVNKLTGFQAVFYKSTPTENPDKTAA